MLVNDVKKIRNERMTHQFFPLWMQIKSPVMVGVVFVSLNSSTSGRGEVGFCISSNNADTHNSTLRRT